MAALDPADDRLWSADILRAENIGGRGLRKWISLGRFPKPDGNLAGRNFWFRRTYERWRLAVAAGKYSQTRRPVRITMRGRRSKQHRREAVS